MHGRLAAPYKRDKAQHRLSVLRGVRVSSQKDLEIFRVQVAHTFQSSSGFG